MIPALMKPSSFLTPIVCLIPLFGVLLLDPLPAAEIVVTTNLDSVGDPAGPPAGSLRKAVEDALSGDTITFAPALSGATIALDGQAISVNKSLTIDASALADPISIDAGGTSRVLETAAIASVTLRKLVLANGDAMTAGNGGAVYGGGDLYLFETTITGSHADSGGAIFHAGYDLSLSACTLSGNSASSFGGAIFVSSVLDLDTCTLANNSSGVNGGAIYLDSGASLTASSCTISDNETGPGAAIAGPSTVTLNRTILAGNLNESAVESNLSVLAVNPIGMNFIGDTGGLPNFGTPGVDYLTGDPMLGPLGDHGGPTATLLPLAGSPVIDATVDWWLPPFDQRGLPRPKDGDGDGLARTDIGAVEYYLGTVDTASDENDSPAGTLLSLREAIADHSLDGIVFAPALSGATILLDHGPLVIDRSLAVDASGLADPVVIDAGGLSRVMQVNPLRVATLKGVVITGGRTADGSGTAPSQQAAPGGGILNLGTLTLREVTITGNTTGRGYEEAEGGIVGPGGRGGGISNAGTLVIERSTISGNSTGRGGNGLATAPGWEGYGYDGADGGSGGGIDQQGGSLRIHHSTIAGNTTGAGGNGGDAGSGGDGGHGAGIHHSGGTLLVTETTISGNATGSGNPVGGTGGGSRGQGGAVYLGAVTNLSIVGSIAAANLPEDVAGPGALSQDGPNLIGGDPVLAPLGDYGGATATMPPLPGCPAIDAWGGLGPEPSPTDQRGLPRPVGDGMDLGAVESQGLLSDLGLFWDSDFDGDGNAFGAEHALGTNPSVADPGNSRNLTPPRINGSGEREMFFGLNPAAGPHTIWILSRSPDLSPGSFVPIFRYDGSTDLLEVQPGIEAKFTPAYAPGMIQVTDTNQPMSRAFYRVEAGLVPPPP